MTGTPERFYHVSQTQLSVARLYGGCKVNGAFYRYLAADDCLVREDVFRADEKAKAQHRREERKKWMALKDNQLDALRAEMVRDEEPEV